jgi:hypothetical protein
LVTSAENLRSTSPRTGPGTWAHSACAALAVRAASATSAADAAPMCPNEEPVAFSTTSIVPSPGVTHPLL